VFLEEYDGWVDFFEEQVLTKAKQMREGKLCCDPKKKTTIDNEDDDDLFERLIEDDPKDKKDSVSIMDLRTRGNQDILKLPIDDDDDDGMIELQRDGDDIEEDDNSLAKYFRSNEDSVKPSAEEYEVNTDGEDIFRVTLTTRDKKKLSRYQQPDDDEDGFDDDDGLEVVYDFGNEQVDTIQGSDLRTSLTDEPKDGKKVNSWMEPAALLIQDDEEADDDVLLPPSYNKLVIEEKEDK